MTSRTAQHLPVCLRVFEECWLTPRLVSWLLSSEEQVWMSATDTKVSVAVNSIWTAHNCVVKATPCFVFKFGDKYRQLTSFYYKLRLNLSRAHILFCKRLKEEITQFPLQSFYSCNRHFLIRSSVFRNSSCSYSIYIVLSCCCFYFYFVVC